MERAWEHITTIGTRPDVWLSTSYEPAVTCPLDRYVVLLLFRQVLLPK